jgi:integration host factor subunit alpha
MPLSGALTKARIVEAVVETNGYTQHKAYEIIEILLELIKRSLESGEDVMISGFGKF